MKVFFKQNGKQLQGEFFKGNDLVAEFKAIYSSKIISDVEYFTNGEYLDLYQREYETLREELEDLLISSLELDNGVSEVLIA